MIAVYLIILLIVAVIVAAVVVMLRTAQFPFQMEDVEPSELADVDGKPVAERLSTLVQIPTVSTQRWEDTDPAPFMRMLDALRSLYPKVFSTLHVEIINKYSLLMFWKGSDLELDPVLYTAHLDVVPADPATLTQWTAAPFSGEIRDGFVWGRGTLDIKSQVVAVLESVSTLIASGWTPRRSIFLAFGADEEVGGKHGAREIAALLKERGVHLAALLDEGGSLLSGVIPGVDATVALLGNSEKGYMSLKLWVDAQPGHSSTPPDQSAIGIMASAIERLESQRLPIRPDAMVAMYRFLGSAVDFSMQMALANLWLFGGIVRQKLLASPETAASVRTTTAPTIFHSGVKDNVMPARAEAVVNFRLLPGDSIGEVCEAVRRIINDDRVQFEPLEEAAWEAAPVAPVDGAAFEALATTVRQVFPDVLPVPYLMLGATDSRHYAAICDNLFRFTPCLTEKDDLPRVHGINERISIEALGSMVKFFVQLMRTWDEAAL